MYFKNVLSALIAFSLMMSPLSLGAASKEFRAETQKITGSGTMWDDYQFGRPGVYSEYNNDFFGPRDAYGDFVSTEVLGGAGASSMVITDEANGVFLLTNRDADDDSISLQLYGESFLPTSGKNIYCEARIKLSDATQMDALFGLVVRDTTPLAHANGMVFHKDDGDTNWDFSTIASSTTSEETGIATAGTGYIKLGFKVTGTSTVEYWVDDSSQGSFNTNLPSTELALTLHVQNGEAAVKTLSVDYAICSQQT